MGVEPFDDEDFGDDKRFDDADERLIRPGSKNDSSLYAAPSVTTS